MININRKTFSTASYMIKLQKQKMIFGQNINEITNEKQLKIQFYKLAKQHHPDLNGDQNKFKEV